MASAQQVSVDVVSGPDELGRRRFLIRYQSEGGYPVQTSWTGTDHALETVLRARGWTTPGEFVRIEEESPHAGLANSIALVASYAAIVVLAVAVVSLLVGRFL